MSIRDNGGGGCGAGAISGFGSGYGSISEKNGSDWFGLIVQGDCLGRSVIVGVAVHIVGFCFC